MDNPMYKETISHSSKDFLFEAYYSYFDASVKEVLPLHWHDTLEFFYLEAGNIKMYIENKPIEVQAGEGVFINANQLHGAEQTDSSACSFYVIAFDHKFICPEGNDLIYYRFIDPILNNKSTFPNHFTKDVPWQADILHALSNIIETCKYKLKGYQLTIKGEAFRIWSQCIINSTINKENSEMGLPTKRIRMVLEYIHENYQSKIILIDLANLVGLSEGQFCRFFKSVLHRSPFTYINEYRIQQSCVLLRTSNKKIADIAKIIGFDNISYFNKIFLKIMKCTPLKYRKHPN